MSEYDKKVAPSKKQKEILLFSTMKNVIYVGLAGTCIWKSRNFEIRETELALEEYT